MSGARHGWMASPDSHDQIVEPKIDAVMPWLDGGACEVAVPAGQRHSGAGMAGAAVEVGIPTLSIADVNDPALPLAQSRGRTDAVLPIDDNLAPRLFVPVTAAMLDWDR